MAVSYVGAGTAVYDDATSPLSVTNPTCQAGDLLVMFVGQKPSSANSGSVTTPSGWTLVGALTGAGGYGTTLGADTGNTNLRIYAKVAVAGDSAAAVSLAHATTNVLWARTLAFRSATGSFDTSGFASGSDTSSGTAVSATMGSNPGVTAGDMVAWAMCIPTDVTTPSQFSSHNITQTGVTYGTKTEVGELDSSTNNDIGGFIAYAPVSSGTGTANPVITATAGGTTTNVRGPVCMIRMREAAPAGVTASMAVTEPTADGLAGSSDVDVSASLTKTEATGDSLAGSATVTDPPVTASMSVTEPTADGLAGVFDVDVSTSMSKTEAAGDTAAGSVDVDLSASLARTEAGPDTMAATAGVRVSGSMVVTEAAGDGLAGQASAWATLSLTKAEAAGDGLAGQASAWASLNLVITEAGPDTFAADAVLSEPWRNLSMAVTEAAGDSLAGQATVRVSGLMAVTESGSDTAAGSVAVRVSGSMSVSESGPDALSGALKAIVSGLLAVQESGTDGLAGSSDVDVSAAMVITESGPDLFEGLVGPAAFVEFLVPHTSSLTAVCLPGHGNGADVFAGSSLLAQGFRSVHIQVAVEELVGMQTGAFVTKSMDVALDLVARVAVKFYPFIEGRERFARLLDVRRRDVYLEAEQGGAVLDVRRRSATFDCVVKKQER